MAKEDCNYKERDALGRREHVNFLSDLIRNNKSFVLNEALTIAIDGSWGTGKTYFMDLLKKDIMDNDSEYLIIEYNCWEKSYYEEPMKAIATSFMKEIRKSDSYTDSKEKYKQMVKYLKKIIINQTEKHIEKYTGIDVRRTPKKDNEFETLDTVIAKFKKSLRDLAQERRIVILIDELDRCLPEYAIQVLNRIYFLFHDIYKLTVVIATDYEQLKNAIEAIFGNNFSYDEYMAKFIDYSVRLGTNSMLYIETITNPHAGPRKVALGTNYYMDIPILEKFPKEYIALFNHTAIDFEDPRELMCEVGEILTSCIFKPTDTIRDIEKTIKIVMLIHDHAVALSNSISNGMQAHRLSPIDMLLEIAIIKALNKKIEPSSLFKNYNGCSEKLKEIMYEILMDMEGTYRPKRRYFDESDFIWNYYRYALKWQDLTIRR